MRNQRRTHRNDPPAIQFDAPSDEAPGYANLCDRAVDFVQHRGGAANDEELVAFVFGSIGAAQVWQSLLATILAREPRLIHQPDGRWTLRDSAHLPATRIAGEFVAIDVETTGLQARTHRVIDVALIRFRDGREVERIDSLINPSRRIPKYIAKLTGIDDDRVSDAPAFGDLAASIEEFLDGALLVGHNVGFDIAFLSAELNRVGRKALINERLDTMSLATRLLPDLRRPSLDKIATHLGLTPRKIHRAGIDAELTARVAYLLLERARGMGIDSLDRVKSIGSRPAAAPADPVGRGRAVLDKALLAEIPKAPGVYLMHDQHERIIYVGKAKNLRDRVSSYYSQPLGYTRKMDGLLESLVRIETVTTGSELGALLLESQLIRRYQPRYNVMMRQFERYPFIRVDLGNPWPRVTLAKARKDDGARYFGPYKSPKAARIAVELVNEHFPLRTCRRSFKDARSYGAPCLRLDLGKCPGPCVGRADRDAYMVQVREALTFLEGDDETLLLRLQESLEAAAQTLDFERARRLRNDLHTLQTIVGAHREIRDSQQHHTLLVVQPAAQADAVEVMLVVRGRRWASLVAARDDAPANLAERLAAIWERADQQADGVGHDELDEIHILNRWIARHEIHPAVLWFDDAQPDWITLSATALSRSDAELTAPVADGDDEEEGSDGLDAVLVETEEEASSDPSPTSQSIPARTWAASP